MRNHRKPGQRTRAARLGSGGNVVIEFAILAPVFFFFMIASIDFARALYEQYRLSAAVAAGADYATVALPPGASWSTAIGTNIAAAMTADAGSGATITPTAVECSCPGTCAASFSTCTSSVSSFNYFVGIQATESFSTYVKYPFMSQPYTLIATQLAPVQ